MKVLILTDEYPPIIGGAGIVAKQLYDDLRALKHKVSIFIPNRGIFGAFLFKLFWFFYYLNPSLINKIKEQDKIIINDIRSAYFISVISIFIKIDLQKVNYILHGTEYEIIYNPNIKNKLILLPFFYNRLLKRINSIIAVSNYTRGVFLKYCTIENEISNKIKVVYCGISKSIKPSFHSYDNNHNEFKLVSISRLEPRKGYFEMFDIFKELLKKKSNISWYIYGDGSIKKELEGMIESHSLQNKIFIMGSKNRFDIYRKEFPYYKFDLFWLIPNKPEAFGLVFLESSMVGVPALGIKKYGIIESVNDLFYTDIPSLIYLIEDIESNKKTYIENAVKFAKKFDSNIFAINLLK